MEETKQNAAIGSVNKEQDSAMHSVLSLHQILHQDLSMALESLEKRLDPILAPRPIDDSAKEDLAASSTSMLVQAIEDSNTRLRRACTRLQIILNNLDI